MTFAPIEDAVGAISRGEFVVVVDDEDRENEGDLILAAEKATPEKIGFMVRHTSGIICVPLTGERLDELRIPMMVMQNTDARLTAFTVSVDYRPATTTGISAADRAATIRAMVDRATEPEDLTRPGHIFPLRYRPGGVLRRAGHTEAAVDLATLAGLGPAGVLAEIVADDGSVARLGDLKLFARKHHLVMIQIADLIAYRRRRQRLIRRGAEARIPTEFGVFEAIAYESLVDHREHLALVKGEISGKEDVLVRVHSECLTGDTLGSLRCDCGFQLRDAMSKIAAEGSGVVLYLRGHEGRGIGLMHKLEAYALQDHGRDTVEANLELGLPTDARDYGVGAQILADLGITTMRLLTNNPTKRAGIEGYGLEITETVPLEVRPNPENLGYLTTKVEKLGHSIHLEGADATP
ncbi:riboflavin biosynthesis protein RibBA [bacterium BMS3Abin02]|nr:riboflavin biosynthesis protein RibBA [bacterium BMS3Abin02]GBE21396.1 riboflavin biosynthesis protein RibBA [bacterium BMS3Bbin01]HDH24589.1 bifunctional 3,4-dihydroxy-2-butanone-4-phosphate synthase/GTP cyclohydrolase II [Actinomycetota bacterium]HDK45654.1 bifunctional 3,4-dihydroxy-2-butanone-4-phosphate synthase/GTP cyclohydrolase II [Actinomycetota bacterium]HDL49710.1 bifunctional 3,4-dihydroxy-2-butanone-4-phosphate synthase/GTP cyclohydrolase II [Actinomycetota bacterium]